MDLTLHSWDSSGGGGDSPQKKDLGQGVLIRYFEVEP